MEISDVQINIWTEYLIYLIAIMALQVHMHATCRDLEKLLIS